MKAAISESDHLTIYRDGTSFFFEFHGPEAKGTIGICPGAYGLWIIDEKLSSSPIALVDLFYHSPEGMTIPGEPRTQVALYDEPFMGETKIIVAFAPDKMSYFVEPPLFADGEWITLAEKSDE